MRCLPAKEPFDPMEKSIKHLADKITADPYGPYLGCELLKEYHLQDKLMAMSRVWRAPDKKNLLIASKGAPEAIIEMCHLSRDQEQAIMKDVSEIAASGQRVIAVAKGESDKSILPDDQHGYDLEFVGLLGFEDPIRPEAPPAIKECYQAGIRIIMITGDYPQTALHIAKNLGLKHKGPVITGNELSKMGLAELRKN
jgi:Ca2+-transporting ATPase